jgi:PTH1 family peptidyl-tRNA hydrolase
MRLIVGLGNPGGRYADTLHNAGFAVCDRFAARHAFPAFSAKFQGLFARKKLGPDDVGLLKPQTFMNLSGDSVAEALRYLPVELADVIVVYDEIDIPAGRIRLRKAGGSAGHNGVRSVIERVGGEGFPRIRIGIGRPPKGRVSVSKLLSRAGDGEREQFEQTLDLAVEALDVALREGFEAAMNRFNRRGSEAEAETRSEGSD